MTTQIATAAPSVRPPVHIDIDWDALEIAVERNAPDSDSYLDLTTGRVLTITEGDPEALVQRENVTVNIRNFLRVEPASSREQYRWMERFVLSVTDEPLRERLVISIDGKGAFRRFKDVLLGFPVERERWFSYRAELLHWHIHNWLEQHNIFGNNVPPWGALAPPVELPLVVVHDREAELKKRLEDDETDKRVSIAALHLARQFTAKISATNTRQLYVNLNNPAVNALLEGFRTHHVGLDDAARMLKALKVIMSSRGSQTQAMALNSALSDFSQLIPQMLARSGGRVTENGESE